jgi:hypothetical protein
MKIHRRSWNSSELLKVGVEPAKARTPVDITTFPVSVAVVLEGVHPVSGDFTAGQWETIDGLDYATVLVGPSGITTPLTDEPYIPWVRVTAGAQSIEAKCFEDVIEVY